MLDKFFRRSPSDKQEVPKPYQVDPEKLSVRGENVEKYMLSKVIDQPRAVRRMVHVYQRFIAQMNDPTRPIEVLLFLGPTGTGKTHTVEKFSEAVFGKNVVIKLDCAEFHNDHDIARLIGSPPGYIGSDCKACRITNEILNEHLKGQPLLPQFSIVLFDEIEKGGEALHRLLFGIMDKGVMTLGDGRKVDFTKTVLVMTSNLGSKEIDTVLSGKKSIGFVDTKSNSADDDQTIYESAMVAVRRFFDAAFVGRIDRCIVFRPLDTKALQSIVSILLDDVQEHLLNTRRFILLAVSDAARLFLLSEGSNRREGARHLKKAVRRFVSDPIAGLIASFQVVSGDMLYVEHEGADKEFSFSVLSDVVDVPKPPQYVSGGEVDPNHICIRNDYNGKCVYCKEPIDPMPST